MSTTRERIISATTELFRSQGFNGTSLKQVTAAAHATTGSVYHFFPGGKDELGTVVIRESGAAYQVLFELIADDATDIVGAIGALFEGAADALENTNYIDICPIGSIAREVASTHEPLREATVDVFTGWTEAFSTRLESAGIERDAAAKLSDTVIAALEGGFILARSRRTCDGLRATGTHMQQLIAATITLGA